MKTPSKAPAKTGSKAAVPTAKITVELPEPLLSALDSWIVEQTDRPSREEAVGIILLEWLASAGTRSDEDFPERRSRDRRKTPKPVATERRKNDRRGGAGDRQGAAAGSAQLRERRLTGLGRTIARHILRSC